MLRRVMLVTGGGDCPGLNAVIRAVVNRAEQEKDWEVVGSIEAFNGILREPTEIVVLDKQKVAGIHYLGGTIIQTTNKGGPFSWPVRQSDDTWQYVDRSDEMIRKIGYLGIEAVINIGGDGSQRISQKLFEKGLNIIGVPKTIDNDLSATDSTFGFQTAVQIATDAVDKLVTTAQSHNRVQILEVMGREAGWIALHSAIAGGAEICLLPEFPYDINKVLEKIESRFKKDRGFINIVISEGARSINGFNVSKISTEPGYENRVLGGIGFQLEKELKAAGCEHSIRTTVLGHLQRGGVPIAYDRVLASRFGVKAFELVLNKEYGTMVSLRNSEITGVPLKEAISRPNRITEDTSLLKTALGLGICIGI